MLVSRALATKIGVGVAAAAIAVSGAAAADAATTHHARPGKVPTALTITAGPGHVRKHRYPHTVAWIKGHLTTATKRRHDVAGATVILERDIKGVWTPVQDARTGRHGWVRFRVDALRHGASFKLVFLGTKHLKRAVSDIITIAPVK
ncbi:MAG TPA: hypothetical protein VEL03_07805 [Streptosporangiaceae bacterium]|nr:hypothetical protein [Streptosporangiaceae bacterium]